jgi:hypothetical protein
MYFTLITEVKNYYSTVVFFLHTLATLACLLELSRAAVVLSSRWAATASAMSLLLMGELLSVSIPHRQEAAGTFPVFVWPA